MTEKLIELNKENLYFNLNFYKQKVNKNIIAVIKDNAYGHGLKEVIEILDSDEIKAYAVANIDEALIASKYTKKDILILDKVSDFSLLNSQMIITVISYNHLQEILNSKINMRVHLKINTGMNRKGIHPQEFKHCYKIINESQNIKLEGIYTHYASNKKKDLNMQYECFKNTIKSIKKDNYLIHASSSISSLLLRENLTNTCRIGIGLYGINHRYEVLKETKPVLTLYSYIDKCTPIKKKEKIGYSYMYKAPEDGFVVLSPFGYGLGYLIRKHYKAFYKGRYLKQACRVCMDCCIYFSKFPIEEKEKIELFGEHVKVDEIAKLNKCSPYEIVTLLNKDIKRIII